ncbi:phytoene desaturase family protein [Pseudolysinimonas sp.]|jgi:phytoene dehydrogenase-like protein|uniref:phytoene desaturase family protein n=1 Tax=Pseudolysinimonas sp. TaxID=2680009 RepID=UPI003784117F
MTDLDAVVVGAGPNGLVAAVALAQAGWKVVLFEAAERAGGGLRTEELTLPGFRHDLGSTVHALGLASPAFRALDLAREGLQFAHPPLPLGHTLAPGSSVLLHRSAADTAAGLGRDGRHWRRVFGGLGDRWEGLVASILDPTALPPRAPRELFEVGLNGLWPATWTNRFGFREEPARALFAGLAVHGAVDLHEPVTSAIALLLGGLAHGVGWPVAVGGSQSIADALVRRLESLGGELRTGHRVTSLAELPSARATILDLTPRQVLDLAGDRLPARYAARLGRWRYGPAVFKADWALDGPIPWLDPELAGAGTVHIGGTGATVAASERAAARGTMSDEPYVLLVQASVADASRAPAGKHTVWAYTHIPYGSDLDATDILEARIEQHAPGFRDRALGRHVLTPAGLESYNANLVGGDIAGGATDWRQLISRPRVSLTPWATPLPDLFLCSSSTLPGGGVHGMGGWNAAKTVLRRLG